MAKLVYNEEVCLIWTAENVTIVVYPLCLCATDRKPLIGAQVVCLRDKRIRDANIALTRPIARHTYLTICPSSLMRDMNYC